MIYPMVVLPGLSGTTLREIACFRFVSREAPEEAKKLARWGAVGGDLGVPLLIGKIYALLWPKRYVLDFIP